MKKVTILFAENHLAYSPTVIGLYDLLSQHFDVTIVALNPKSFTNTYVANRKVVYLNERPINGIHRYMDRIRFELSSLFRKDVLFLKKKNIPPYFLHKFDQVKTYLSKENPDLIIAVDFKNLLITQTLGKRVEFLSLEIEPNNPFYKACDFQNIDSVIIQTKERYEHLFKDLGQKTFFIQNSPSYTPAVAESERKGLVYSGTAWDAFGFYHILEFLKKFPEHSLTSKGAMLDPDLKKVKAEYSELTSSGSLTIDDEYLDEREMVDHLRKFRIGFCFYNFEVGWINNFNYFSAPSGKMFKYFAAGVPVVGQDILGLDPVREFDCGVLIKDLLPESIKAAIETIEKKFDYYSRNCLKAAAHYSFDKMAAPFVEYLLNKK